MKHFLKYLVPSLMLGTFGALGAFGTFGALDALGVF